VQPLFHLTNISNIEIMFSWRYNKPTAASNGASVKGEPTKDNFLDQTTPDRTENEIRLNSSLVVPQTGEIHNAQMKAYYAHNHKHFLALPANVRKLIIWHFVVDQKSSIIVRADDKKLCEQPTILSVCKQVRDEGLPIFYRENSFEVRVEDYNIEEVLFWLKLAGYHRGSVQVGGEPPVLRRLEKQIGNPPWNPDYAIREEDEIPFLVVPRDKKQPPQYVPPVHEKDKRPDPLDPKDLEAQESLHVEQRPAKMAYALRYLPDRVRLLVFSSIRIASPNHAPQRR
jgi:hypothetical protein